MNRRNRQIRPQRGIDAEASYDEASRARYRVRASRPGGSGGGGDDHGFVVARRWFVAAMAAVAAKLAWLQIFDAKNLSEKAERQRTNTITLHAKRGTIYDRNGNVLAMSVDCKTVYANPKDIKKPSEVADLLAKYLGGTASDYLDSLKLDTTFVYLKKRVDEDVADGLKSAMAEAELTGVYYLSDTKRVYPYGTVAQQVLGMVGGDDGATGISGLEYQYNDVLTGTDGEMLLETGNGGIPIAGGASQVTEAKNGTDLVLALDADLQESCEKIIAEAIETYNADSGSVMVMNPRTGEILAACSTPLPDLSNLTDAAALNLKLVSSNYEPGSVFKVLTTSIGFELGLFDTETNYHVPQTIKVGDSWVNDSPPLPSDMDMTVRYMMQHSSNVAMAMLVQEVIGAEKFAAGVDKYGIGHITGIDYPGESAGIVKALKEYDGSTAGSMAFGQGLAVPMVQIVRAFAAVANGGVPTTPHFVTTQGDEELSWPAGERIISEDSAKKETDVMRTVMQEGTGKTGQVDGYDFAGKTGTGEQASEEGGYGAFDYVASLCGFAQASDPELLVYAGLNGTAYLAYSSASTIFHDVASQAVSIMGIPPTA